MSIEKILVELTMAVQELTVAVKGATNSVVPAPNAALPELPGTPIEGVPQPKKGPGRPPKAAAPTPTAVAPVASTPVEADPFAEDGAAAAEEKKLTEGDVRLVLQALRDRKGDSKVVFEIMKKVAGADTLPKVDPKFYKAIVAAAQVA